MADTSRQFEGTRDGDSIRITPVKPLGERNMVKFDKTNPVHMELMRSLGDSAPHKAGTMKAEEVALHPGGYFSTPKAPVKNLSEEGSTEAVAKPKRTYTKKTVGTSPKKRPQGTGHKRVAPTPAPAKKTGGVWGDLDAKIKATAAETESKSKKGRKKK